MTDHQGVDAELLNFVKKKFQEAMDDPMTVYYEDLTSSAKVK